MFLWLKVYLKRCSESWGGDAKPYVRDKNAVTLKDSQSEVRDLKKKKKSFIQRVKIFHASKEQTQACV